MSDDQAGSPYTVTWVLPELYCEGPVEAAQAAREAQQDPDNQATFYTVTDKDGKEFNVDLQFEGKDALIKD